MWHYRRQYLQKHSSFPLQAKFSINYHTHMSNETIKPLPHSWDEASMLEAYNRILAVQWWMKCQPTFAAKLLQAMRRIRKRKTFPKQILNLIKTAQQGGKEQDKEREREKETERVGIESSQKPHQHGPVALSSHSSVTLTWKHMFTHAQEMRSFWG